MQIVYPNSSNNIPIWYHFLQTFYKNELEQIGRDYPKNHSFYINYSDIKRLGEHGNTLVNEFKEYPIKVFEDIHDVIINYNLIKTKDGKVPQNLKIRFTNFPEKIVIHEIDAVKLNKFVSVRGLICKITAVHPQIVKAFFRCPAGHFTEMNQKDEKLIEPDGCATAGCTFKKLELIPTRSIFVDFQKIKIKEIPDDIPNGIISKPLDIHISDDITGTVNEGDQVIVNGILRTKPCKIDNSGNTNCIFDYFLEVNSIEIIHRNIL